MRKMIGLFLVATTLIFTSCGDDESSINLVFQANFGNEVLELGKSYEMADGKKFNISRSDMFLSDVRLIADDGTEVMLYDYIQVDFENSPGGVRFETIEIPAQNYESISFGLGLNDTQNKTKPEDYPADDPLNNGGYYWLAWDSYIFTKTEGRVDDDGDSTPEQGWIFHTGKDDLLREVNIDIDTKLGGNSSDELRLVLDHQPLFIKDGAVVELGITHDPTDLEVLGTFMDRFAASISKK